MNDVQATFCRYEKKYFLTGAQYDALLPALAQYFHPDAYADGMIYNIYFDTPTHMLVRHSLEKPVYKEKLRLRSYCVPSPDDTVFVELKKKYEGVVYKRRVPMSYAEAMHYLYGHEAAANDSQITREIDWTLHYYQELCPALYLSYHRLAFAANGDETLRLTIDSDIRWREDQLTLDAEAPCRDLLSEGERLMEIKIADAMPLWLAHTLDRLQVFPVSFSKYGMAYMQSRPQENPCSSVYTAKHTPQIPVRANAASASSVKGGSALCCHN